MRIIILSVFFFLLTSNTEGKVSDILNNDPVKVYIGKYKEIAISEMHRSGIPASIKLAQGILESNSGRSTLARKANNHFGIKCGKYWVGSTFYREDDDYKNGKLIESCFRRFNNGDHSFIAHSDFLTNPGSQYRYGFLFKLNPTDYIEWARGLKKSGYATDPKYSNKLISIIESYELFLFDEGYIHINPDENMIANVSTSPKEKIKFQPKFRKASSAPSFEVRNGEHLVRANETMKEIADKYNIELNLFYFQNRMPNGSQPKVGDKLKIDSYFHWGKKPELQKKKNAKEEKLLFENESMTITIQ